MKQFAKMHRSLTKQEYYLQRRIPKVHPCKKLEAERPPRAYLLQMLPKLSSQIAKVHVSDQKKEKKTLQKLSTAIKIIHQLEEELDITRSKLAFSEEQIKAYILQSEERQRKICDLSTQIDRLRSSLQLLRGELSLDIDKCNDLVRFYEKRATDLLELNSNLQKNLEIERNKKKVQYENLINKIQLQYSWPENKLKIQQGSHSQIKRDQIQQNGLKRNDNHRPSITQLSIENDESKSEPERTQEYELQINSISSSIEKCWKKLVQKICEQTQQIESLKKTKSQMEMSHKFQLDCLVVQWQKKVKAAEKSGRKPKHPCEEKESWQIQIEENKKTEAFIDSSRIKSRLQINLQNEKLDLQKKNQKLFEQIVSAQQRISQASKKLEQTKGEKQILVQFVRQQEKQLLILMENLRQIDRGYASVKGNLCASLRAIGLRQKQLIGQSQQMRQKIKLKQDTVESFQKKLQKQNQIIRQELTAKNERIRQLQQIITKQKVKSQLTVASQKRHDLDLQQVSQKLLNSKQRLEDMQNQKTVILKMNAKLEKRIVDLQYELKIKEEIGSKPQHGEYKKDENTELNNQIDKITKSNEVMSQNIKRQTLARETIVNQKDEIIMKQMEQIKSLLDVQYSLKQEIKTLQYRSSQSSQRIKQLLTQIQQLMSALQKIRQKHENSQSQSSFGSRNEDRALREQLQAIEESKGLIKKQLAEKQNERKRLTEEIQYLKKIVIEKSEREIFALTKLDAQQKKNQEIMKQLSRLATFKIQCSEKDEQIRKYSAKIESLEKEMQRAESDIMKIYQESDKRVDLMREEIKSYYQSELAYKNKDIQNLNKKIKFIQTAQRQEYGRKLQSLDREKQELYRQMKDKNFKLKQVTNSYKSLVQVYDHLIQELQMYKRKWNRIFLLFSESNQELIDFNLKLSKLRTQDRRIKRQIQQPSSCKGYNFFTTADNRSPYYQHGLNLRDDPLLSVCSFNESKQISLKNKLGPQERQKFTQKKVITSLMSGSGLILNSKYVNQMEDKFPDRSKSQKSDISLKLQCSSVNSKINQGQK